MNSTPESQTRTRTFARVFDPFFVVVPVIIVLRAPDMKTLLPEFGANPL